MNNKKYHAVGAFPKSNREMVETRDIFDIRNTRVYATMTLLIVTEHMYHK